MSEHCKRSDGSDRRWFRTPEEAAHYRDHHLSVYGDDVIVFCTRCELFHCSHPSWLASKPWEILLDVLVS